ncbi:c-type cytochrome biogenesis protein CcmI [Halopseudomonas pelagia]|uniref:c-type cytochrome biogenesis protein CcmI n=1 Tax=Halopseudomonas pelagia TaxID=553151 RepID=UPI0003A25E1F|nr:c-type cytochrome biogenesis protein CcmI [Halopseudomonas pelagia]
MTDFWLLSVLLLIMGVLAVIWPLWKHRRHQAVDRAALNVALYQERMAELDAQVAAGDLTTQERDDTLEEASRLLLEDTARADGDERPGRRGGPWMLIISAGLLPLIVVGLYFAWGNPAGLSLYRDMQTSPQPANLEAMIDRMQRITEVQPENGEAWYMLGRAYLSAQQPDLAVNAFGQSLERLGERPEVLAQLAQARFFAAGNQLDSPAVAALNKALELEPREPTALGLLGIAAFESGDYPAAIDYWQRLLAGMPPGGEGAQAIQGGIDRARERIAAAGGEQPAQEEQNLSEVISLRLELSEEVAAQVDPDAVIFVFARDPAGPPMPLVARRFSVAELPVDVLLSAADAMLPDVELSEGQVLQLTARLSPTGDAMQGSHQGQVDEVRVGDPQAVLLVIDQVIDKPTASVR